MCRLSIFLAAFFLSSTLFTQEKPQAFFYIVSVPPPEGFPELPSLKERAENLKDFILETYNPDSNHIRVLESTDETSVAKIKTILYSEIPNNPPDSIIFFFLLTHADVQWYKNSPSARADLQIVASDTTKRDMVGTSIHGSELLAAFVHAPLRSQIFTFIDSCDSGALGTPLGKAIASSNSMGAKMYVLTSSAAGERSYAGNFTKALVDVWRSQGSKCVGKSLFLDAMNKALAANNQRVQEIVPFNGPCLNFANQEVGLLVVWNTGQGSIYFELPDGSTTDPVDVHDDEPTLVPLPRTVQVVGVFSSDKHPLGALQLDFSSSPVTLYKAVEEKDEKRIGQQYLKAAERVADFGFVREAQVYKAFAVGWARKSHNSVEAQKIEASIDKSLASKEVIAALGCYHSGAECGMEGINQKEVGDLLASLGHFQAAYSVYLRELDKGNVDPQMFGGLYTSLVVAGKEKAAKELRQQYPDLFEQSAEAKETRVLLNAEVVDASAAIFNGLESAASRTGLVVNPSLDVTFTMQAPPPF